MGTPNRRVGRKIGARLNTLLAKRESFSIPLPIIATTLAGELLVLLKWWLDNKMPYTPEEINAAFQQLLILGIRATLGKTDSVRGGSANSDETVRSCDIGLPQVHW
jgi:hypothetical protein